MPGRPAGSPIAVYAQVQCREPKTGKQKVQLYWEDNKHCQSGYIIYLCLAGRLGQLFQYMCEYSAESTKQGGKRFNSQGRQNTVPIWVYNLSMARVFFGDSAGFPAECSLHRVFSLGLFSPILVKNVTHSIFIDPISTRLGSKSRGQE